MAYRYNSLTPPLAPKERVAATAEPGLESATVYVVDFMEPGAVATRPVPIPKAEFQRAFLRLSRDVRLKAKTPQAAARELLHLLPPPKGVETVDSQGDWLLEMYRDQAYPWCPSARRARWYSPPRRMKP